MSTTEVELCNLALFRVRANEIGDLNEQSVNAEKCRVFYPQARDTVLAEAPWGFAKTTRALSLKSEEPEQWQYLYDHPNDCVTALYIIPPGATGIVAQSGVTLTNVDVEHIPFEIMLDSSDSKSIATNYKDAKLAYIKYVTDVKLFTPAFEEAVIWKLAHDLAIPLGGDSGKKYRDDAARAYQSVIEKAKAQAFNQQVPRKRQQRPREIQARAGSIYSRNYNGQPYWR
jgi:hypothetical protein